MVVSRIVKPKTQRGKRALKKVAPKVYENVKTAMFIKGGNTSMTVTQVLKELHMLKKPNSVSLRRKNCTRPFEDQTSIEFFGSKSDSSLFLFGSHSKKRPDNLVMGRLFDGHVLDMLELGIDKFKSMFEFKTTKSPIGTKPCLLFAGELFDNDDEYRRIKNLMIDFFRGPVVDNICLAGLEHVISIMAADEKIYIRNYRTQLKKSGSRVPRVELEETGPSLNLSVRRSHLASTDLYKKALRVPRIAKPVKKKNISHDVFRNKLGRVHMQKQDLKNLQTRKMKGLKKRKSDMAREGKEGTRSKKVKTSE